MFGPVIAPPRKHRRPSADPGVAGATAAPLASRIGNRGMLQLLRKARPPDPDGRRPWIEQATAASERRARAMDELENLSDDELRRRRDDLVYKATAARSDQQQAAAEMLEDLEAVAEARGIEPREENYSGSAYIPKRVNLRARVEAGSPLHGSFKRVIDEIKLVDTSSGTAADLEFFQAEMNAFKAEFRGRARQTAIDMLTGSVTAIRTIVTAYGLPWDMTKLAAQDLARTGDLDKEIDDVVELAAKKSDIDDPRYEKQRLELRNNARHLKQLQDKVAKKAAVEEQNLAQYRNDPAGFEREHGAAARAADKELTAARDEFQRAWVEAERLHPVLTALRRHGELEEISLDKLAGASIEDEMHAVLAEVVPKLRDAGRAAAMLRDKHLDPLTLPSVVALTRATMFIPKGSLRDGAINDAVSEAAHADSWLLQLAVFALAAVTFLPSAGASLGV